MPASMPSPWISKVRLGVLVERRERERGGRVPSTAWRARARRPPSSSRSRRKRAELVVAAAAGEPGGAPLRATATATLASAPPKWASKLVAAAGSATRSGQIRSTSASPRQTMPPCAHRHRGSPHAPEDRFCRMAAPIRDQRAIRRSPGSGSSSAQRRARACRPSSSTATRPLGRLGPVPGAAARARRSPSTCPASAAPSRPGPSGFDHTLTAYADFVAAVLDELAPGELQPRRPRLGRGRADRRAARSRAGRAACRDRTRCRSRPATAGTGSRGSGGGAGSARPSTRSTTKAGDRRSCLRQARPRLQADAGRVRRRRLGALGRRDRATRSSRLYRSADPDRLAAAGSRLGELTCPALVVWGSDDPYLGSRARAARYARGPAERRAARARATPGTGPGSTGRS